MSLDGASTLSDVAAAVAGALRRAGVRAVLTGGACATVYSEGAYQSLDLDFILQGAATRKLVDDAMAPIGFSRDGDRYVHPATRFFVEFPRGPLAIGKDFDITPVELKLTGGVALALSSTDACRDRLAGFYHWADRQSLRAAVEIAVRRAVNMRTIRRWSRDEGFEAKFEEFRRALARRKDQT